MLPCLHTTLWLRAQRNELHTGSSPECALGGSFHPLGIPAEQSAGSMAIWQPGTDCGLDLLAVSTLSKPLSLPLLYSFGSTKLSHQPAEVLPIPLRILSIPRRPAGDSLAAGSLRASGSTLAFPSLCLSSEHSGFWCNCSLSWKGPVHAARGYSGHVRVGNCPSLFPLDSPQRHFLGLLLCKKATLASLSLEIQVP